MTWQLPPMPAPAASAKRAGDSLPSRQPTGPSSDAKRKEREIRLLLTPRLVIANFSFYQLKYHRKQYSFSSL
jgi:hypothetical protein